MTTKTTGAEWKRFMADDEMWSDGTHYDDEEIFVDRKPWSDLESDVTEIPDAAIVTIEGGIVYMDKDALDGPSLEAFFRKWKKAQNTEFFMCEVPKNLADAVRAAIIAAGGRVR